MQKDINVAIVLNERLKPKKIANNTKAVKTGKIIRRLTMLKDDENLLRTRKKENIRR